MFAQIFAFFLAQKLTETFNSDLPSQSALTILVHQVDLIFCKGLELLKKVQNMGSKKQGAKNRFIAIQKEKRQPGSKVLTNPITISRIFPHWPMEQI